MAEPTPGSELTRVEVFDATDPDMTSRVRPVVFSAFSSRDTTTLEARSER
ncbi:MAG: hypothetical protein WBG36_13360 [Ornithinimicrobium sp.]